MEFSRDNDYSKYLIVYSNQVEHQVEHWVI